MTHIIAFITSIGLATIAAFFSIVGLSAIFQGAMVPVIIMASALEVGKLVSAVYLHNYWDKLTYLIRLYLFTAVIVLMLITSLGIFGFLSRAHIEQNAPVGNNVLKIERLEQRVSRARAKITDAEEVVSQLDGSLQTLIEYDKISGDDGYRAVREQQLPQRGALTETIESAQTKIDDYEDKKLELNQQLQALELEVGPIKYFAALIYDDPSSRIEEAVRIVILLLVFVFDPLAVVLLISSTSFLGHKEPKNVKTEQIHIVDDIAQNEQLRTEQIPIPPAHKTHREPRPKWLSQLDAIATTKGWIDERGNLLKSMKMTQQQVDKYNRD
mgnify:FL=1